MNPVIFLDIDGVLNTSGCNISRDMFHIVNDIKVSPGRLLSSSRIKNLNDITDSTNADIVISSTWRTDEDCIDVLKASGVTGNIIGRTPKINLKGIVRGNEIHVWMLDNVPYEHEFMYVILDDDSDMLYWQRNHFLLCDRECGLSVDIAYKAKRILTNIIP